MKIFQILEVAVYTLLVLGFVGITSLVSGRLFPVSAKNLAVSFRKGGLYLGTAIAMMALLTGQGAYANGVFGALPNLVVGGLIVTVLLLAAQYVNDKFIVSGIDNSEAVGKDNVAIGITEFGGSVATGLVAYGSLSGGVLGSAFLPAVTFFFLGQLVMVAFFRLYDYLHPDDLLGQIREGRVEVATVVAGLFISLGLVMKTAVGGEFQAWSTDLLEFALYAGVGIALLLVLIGILNVILVRRDGKNVTAALKVATLEVAAALVLSTLI